MWFRAPDTRFPDSRMSRFSGFSPPLQVMKFIATRKGDAERGPKIWMRPDDALIRLVTDGELVRVISGRYSDLAEMEVDETLPRGMVVVRDILGTAPSEVVRVVKPDTDAGHLT